MSYPVNQDPKYWLRLIFSIGTEKTNSHVIHTKQDIHLSEFWYKSDPRHMGGHDAYMEFTPGLNYTSTDHDYLLPEFQCHLPGRLIDEGVMALGEFPSIPFVETFSIGRWANYWKTKRANEGSEDET